jgi:hypothetical protein
MVGMMSKRFTRRFLFLKEGNSHSLHGIVTGMNATSFVLLTENQKWQGSYKNNHNNNMLKKHPLRFISNILHEIAMLLPLPIAKPIANLSSKFYYTKK